MTDEFEQAAIAYYRQQRASHNALHDDLVIAEGQRDQAKMRAEKAEAERDKLAARLEAAIELEAEVSGANRRLRAERDALRKVDDTMVIRFLAGYTMCEDESSVEFSHSAAVRAGLVAALSALAVQPWKHIEPRDSFEIEWTILP